MCISVWKAQLWPHTWSLYKGNLYVCEWQGCSWKCNLQVLCLQDRVLSLFICPSGGSTTLCMGRSAIPHFSHAPTGPRWEKWLLAIPPKEVAMFLQWHLIPRPAVSTEAWWESSWPSRSPEAWHALHSSLLGGPPMGSPGLFSFLLSFPGISPKHVHVCSWKPGSRGALRTWIEYNVKRLGGALLEESTRLTPKYLHATCQPPSHVWE